MPAASATRTRQELARARAADQVHGAYLFSGPAGSGKRETAFWLARLLLCEREGDEPCGSCGGCARSAPGSEGERNHPDLRVLEPDGAVLKIDQVRDLQRGLSLVANEGGQRVALLFGVEQMNSEAANALLKTLEEPPANTTLVLVTTSADALPPTVRSRTTLYRFAAEPEAEVLAALREQGLDDDGAWLAAVLGGGSAAAARAWADEHLEAARELFHALEAAPGATASETLEFAESFRGQLRDARGQTLLRPLARVLRRREDDLAAAFRAYWLAPITLEDLAGTDAE